MEQMRNNAKKEKAERVRNISSMLCFGYVGGYRFDGRWLLNGSYLKPILSSEVWGV